MQWHRPTGEHHLHFASGAGVFPVTALWKGQGARSLNASFRVVLPHLAEIRHSCPYRQGCLL